MHLHPVYGAVPTQQRTVERWEITLAWCMFILVCVAPSELSESATVTSGDYVTLECATLTLQVVTA